MPTTGERNGEICRTALQIFAAEFLGTAMVLFLGCLHDTVAFYFVWTFTMATVTANHIFGPVSGGHVNPGATIVALIMGRIPHKPLVFVYWGAQFAGAMIGYLLHYEVTLMNVKDKSICLTKPFRTTHGQTFGLELAMSFVFFLATAARFDPRNRIFRGSESLTIGFVMFGLYYSMSNSIALSMNTARSLPPAVFLDDFEGHYIYWIAPNMAAILAGGIYRMVFNCRPKINAGENRALS